MKLYKILSLIVGISLNISVQAATLSKVNVTGPKLDGLTTLSEIKNIKLPNGKTIVKLQQHFNGIPVFGRHLVAEKLGSQYTNWDGSVLKGIHKDIKSVDPLISKKDAIKRLVKESNSHNKTLRDTRIYLSVYDKGSDDAKLAYYVSFVIDGTPITRPTGFVDAENGEVLEYWDGLTSKEATGPGGNEKTGKYFYGTDYASFQVTEDCKMESDNVYSINLNHATSGGSIYQIDPCTEKPDNIFKEINGAHSPLNDAHAFGEVVFSMFKDWYDTAPLSFKLVMRVHYSNSYENAFWDGIQMTFGDGASQFYPLVGLDIVAHEVAHGFTEQNSDLIYRNQSGGINESFSDISGEAAKHYFYSKNGGDNDWLVGGTIFKGGADAALRYFEQPEKDGRSIGHASKYVSGMDVHYSSGVFNRAFYLLAHKPNWDIHKAFDVSVLANQMYWQSGATFDTAACGLHKAAEKLGYEVDDVIDAFETVGVSATCIVAPPSVQIYNGIEVSDIDDIQSARRYYFIDIPSHLKALVINTSNTEGDADVYALKDSKPTLQKFDCRSFEKGNKNGHCTFTEPKPGRYFVMLHAYTDYKNLKLQAKFYK